jgi:hypothetical protein
MTVKALPVAGDTAMELPPVMLTVPVQFDGATVQFHSTTLEATGAKGSGATSLQVIDVDGGGGLVIVIVGKVRVAALDADTPAASIRAAKIHLIWLILLPRTRLRHRHS